MTGELWHRLVTISSIHPSIHPVCRLELWWKTQQPRWFLNTRSMNIHRLFQIYAACAQIRMHATGSKHYTIIIFLALVNLTQKSHTLLSPAESWSVCQTNFSLGEMRNLKKHANSRVAVASVCEWKTNISGPEGQACCCCCCCCWWWWCRTVCVCVFQGKEDAISFGCLLGTRLGREIKRKAALFLGLEWGCGLGGGALRAVPSRHSDWSGPTRR